MRPGCPNLDDTLAMFLDGTISTTDGASDHLRECNDCQRGLRRSRRLDAVLAKHSHTPVDDQFAERLFATALPAATSQPQPAPAAWPVAVLGTAMLALGLALGLWLAQHNRDSEPTQVPAQSQDTALAVDTNTIELPNRVTRSANRRRSTWRRRQPHSPVDLLQQPGFDIGLMISSGLAAGLRVLSRPLAPHLPNIVELRQQASELSRLVRLEVGLRTLRSRRESDRRSLLSYLASAEEDRAVIDLLNAVRQDRLYTQWLLRRLQQRQPDRLLVIGAARVGTARIDAALQDAIRRDTSLATAVVDAVHRTSKRPSGARLLLDLWTTLEAQAETDPTSVRSWFHKLTSDATAQLIAMARSTPSQPERRRCLLALAWRRDIDALPYMLELVNDNHHENSLVAGFVMSQLPSRTAASLLHAALRNCRRPYVVLAALFGMRSPLAHEYARTAELTREEADFLLGGRFTESQFSIAARMCKRRQLLAY